MGWIIGVSDVYSFPSVLQVDCESNELVDGSLIDLCGATLLWRTAEGLSHTPTVKHLEVLRQELNAGRPQCPVGFNTLAFPSLRRKDVLDEKQPWAYLRCGHVHGYHGWGGRRNPEVEAECQERECPMCRAKGPYVPLWLGCEAAFYVDAEPPTHAFSPCGHVCSEKTMAYWSQILLPHGTHAFHAACPFCILPLSDESGCVRLIFQSPLDWKPLWSLKQQTNRTTLLGFGGIFITFYCYSFNLI